MNTHLSRKHLSAEALQALLEGQLPSGERHSAQEHLATCVRCTEELEGWKILFRELEQLPELAPSPGFAARVMEGAHIAEPRFAWGRAFGWLRATGTVEHPAGERIQDFAEGVLSPRKAARVRVHLDGCSSCAAQAEAWQATFAALDGLERLAPSEDFSSKVMARVKIPAMAPVRVSEWQRMLAWTRGLVPHTRQAWAAISGVAVTPLATLGLLIWSVFSHPTLTPSALLSFTGWKVAELANVLWQTVASAALESAGVFRLYSFLGSATQSPAALAAGFVVFSLGTVLAAWVLYRNLIMHHPMDGRIAHAQLS